MKSLAQFSRCKVGLVHIHVEPAVVDAVVQAYLNVPLALALVPADVLEARRVVCTLALVVVVLLMGTFTKVGPPVVIGFSVDVVNLSDWPFTSHVEPGKSVKPVVTASQPGKQVAFLVWFAKHVPVFYPSENPGIWVVMRKA